jgi:hypothetical protein
MFGGEARLRPIIKTPGGYVGQAALTRMLLAQAIFALPLV